ncbi:MAG: PKD domain-containing protein [Bacteroidetes bacterium]|nr:PKD domain-containing protein [Bacteroidota bacterium]
MKKISLLVIISLTLLGNVIGQNQLNKPTLIAKPVYFDVSPPLRDMVATPVTRGDNTWKDGVVKNYFNSRKNRHRPTFPSNYIDPSIQNSMGLATTTDTTIQNFEGNSNTQGYDPPDTHGDVGPNHYFQVVNCHFSVYNKSGTLLIGPLLNSSVWSGMSNNSNDGDAVVLYDENADRWLFSQFSLPNYPAGPFYQMIAVSTTPDPTGSWYRWQYSFTDMDDYPKFGVWPDGYYMTCNRFAATTGTYSGTGQAAFNRTKMLAGDASAEMVYFTLPSSDNAYCLLPSDCDGTFPPTGTPDYFVYMMDSPYYLGVYEFHADWITPANSTFGNFLQLTVNTFSSALSGITQKGTTKLADALSDRLMYRLQFRKFGDHWAMVCNHTVNAGSSVGGIRWYELRKTSGTWAIYQQSTYAPDAYSRWAASVALDADGNMAMGYSIASTNMYPSIRYCGRMNNDALNTLTIAEKGIFNGTGSNSTGDRTSPAGAVSRWGDYSTVAVDPSASSTFWYSQQYLLANGYAWHTRIASFAFTLAPTADFSANTVIPCLYSTVVLTDQSTHTPTSWLWSITPATFSFVDGTSSASQNPHVKFNKYGTYSVTLTATNTYGNNSKIKSSYLSVNTVNANFTASLTTVVQNNATVFTDASTCNVTSWSWNFGTGASPATATTAGPHTVTYGTTGSSTVTLMVNGTTTQTKTNYITVTSSAFIMSTNTITTCSGNFYDSGGSGSNYSNNQDFTETFYPSTTNSNIRFVFSSFTLQTSTSCTYDYLKIYNGTNTSATLMGTYCGTTSPGTVTASNTSGALTFVFHSNASSTAAGWAAAISCVAGSNLPIADFTVDNTTPATVSTVSFTDISTLGPTSWLWSFSPATVTYVNSTSATSQNPKVQFNNNGIYNVTLTATNANGSNAKTKTGYIYAGTAGLWTGITSTDWNTASNWHNYIVPSSTTNVTLPTTATNWPSMTGDMVMGTRCFNMVLQNNAILTASGNFNINPGDTLTFNGQGTLKVGGDWNDYGNFNPGTGTIEFNGSSAGKITGGINKAAYVPNYIRSTFAKSMTALSGSTAGPTGDDASMDANIGFTFNYLGVNYTQARINTNGWVSLNLTGPVDAVDNSYLFTTTTPFVTLAPWWDDLKADSPTGVVSYKTEGSSPNRVFTVEWNRPLSFYSGTTTSRVSFQLKLYETTNIIEFCYGSAEAGTHDPVEGASIGLKDATGGTSHFLEASTGSVLTGKTNLISSSNWPAVNYRFTPPSGTETFYNIKENKTNTTITIQPNIIVNGDVIMN